MTKPVKILLFSVIGAALLGGAAYLYIQYKKLMDYCYKFNGLKINKVSLSMISMTVNFLFRNKSDFTIRLEKYDLQVFVNDKKVTDLRGIVNQDILRRAMSNLQLNIYFNPQEFFTGLKVAQLLGYAVNDRDKFIISIKGTVDVKVGIINPKAIPIEVKYTLTELLKPADPNKVEEDCKM